METAAERAVDWAGDMPLLFGGDFNLRPRENPGAFERLRERFGLREPTAPARSTTSSGAASRSSVARLVWTATYPARRGCGYACPTMLPSSRRSA